MFKDKFTAISGSTSAPLSFAEHCDSDECVVPPLSCSNVRDAIAKTNTGVGIDGVHSNHLKFLSVYATRFLTKFLNSCILHNYVPRDMIKRYIKPSVKNSMGDITDSNNYREIMISNNMFKLMEYCLLPLLQKYTNVSSSQLGYKARTSTTMAIAIIKEALMKYKFEGSTVYCCFLELSKAFERVKHDRLIDKLYTRYFPTYLISIIKNIFSGSSVSVLYEGEYSESWNLVRGVRQGGIISAYLFNLYIDDILTSISKTQVGCKLGLSLLSVQAYADDMILMSPTECHFTSFR